MAGTSIYIVCTICPTTRITAETNNVIGAICIFLIFLNLIDLIRVFESFAIFTRMVVDMFLEANTFWLFMLATTAAFASMLMMLNFNRTPEDPIYP
jgi:hypothetical protein